MLESEQPVHKELRDTECTSGALVTKVGETRVGLKSNFSGESAVPGWGWLLTAGLS